MVSCSDSDTLDAEHQLCDLGRQIHDDDAPEVADAFYGYLFRHGPEAYPDSTEAAEALQVAVKKLRTDRAVNFRQWVPFVHFGL